jgi:hypothetical protein
MDEVAVKEFGAALQVLLRLTDALGSGGGASPIGEARRASAATRAAGTASATSPAHAAASPAFTRSPTGASGHRTSGFARHARCACSAFWRSRHARGAVASEGTARKAATRRTP